MGNPAREAEALRRSVGFRATDEEALAVRGDDARAWLQGQVSCDVSATRRGEATYGLIVSLTGKVLTDLWVLDDGDGLTLLLPAGRLSPMQEYLDRYVIMEDVELTPRDVAVIAADGPKADALLPDGYPCDRLGVGGRTVLVDPARRRETIERLRKTAGELGGGEVSEQGWELCRVQLGVPRYGVDFDETTLPQEAGLARRAVSFDKGCYQGQEAVVMLAHRGKPPRLLVRLEVAASSAKPSRGAVLKTPEGDAAGTLTTVVPDPRSEGVLLGLGYLRRTKAEVGTVLTVDGGRARVTEILGGG